MAAMDVSQIYAAANAANQGNIFWNCVYGPQRPNLQLWGPVASYHLFIPETAAMACWNLVRALTSSGELGYMSTMAAAPMTEGPQAGYRCISVHLHDIYKGWVLRAFHATGLVHYIYAYNNYQNEHPQEAYANVVVN